MPIKKPIVLFMAQLPPPVHGASLRNKSVLESKLINEAFNLRPLPLAFASSLSDIGIPSIRKLLALLLYCLKIIREVIFFRPKFAYFTFSPNGFAFFRDCLFAFILRILHVRILFHFREWGVQAHIAGSGIKKRLFRFTLSGNEIVCLSPRHAEDFKGIDSCKKKHIIPNGIKLVVSEKDLARSHSGPPRLLFLSNLIREKGVIEFIEALTEIRRRGLQFEGKIVGETMDISIEETKDLCSRNGISDLVKIVGPRYGQEKYNELLWCDIFIFPTYYVKEVFPGVILEAMQCSKPVITTEFASIPDIIANGADGLLVPPRDITLLTESIQRLITSTDERVCMGKCGRKKYLETYTLEMFEKRMLDVYSQML